MEAHHTSILDKTSLTYEEFCAAYKLLHTLPDFPILAPPATQPIGDVTEAVDAASLYEMLGSIVRFKADVSVRAVVGGAFVEALVMR